MAEGWKFYNHAVIPTCEPHEEVDTAPVYDGSIWKIRGGVFLYLLDGLLTLIVTMRQSGGTL